MLILHALEKTVSVLLSVLLLHHALPAAQVGIVHDLMLRELRLFTDCGRCCRPLFIVDLEAQRLAVTKDDIALLQDRESTNFGWSVGPFASCPCFGAACVMRGYDEIMSVCTPLGSVLKITSLSWS